MLLNPRTPIIVGFILIFFVVRMLWVYSPMPGNLSSPHARVEGMSTAENCSSCHHEEGLAEGCLHCHEEIAAQLSDRVGYHHYMLQEDEEIECGRCHAEHLGEGFMLVNEISWGAQNSRVFRHPHVEYSLEGKHDSLSCGECHEKKLEEPFALEDFASLTRRQTFLGLAQECVECHEDIHADGLSDSCDSCHGQEEFRPTTEFDHNQHFTLDGGHERLECAGCHRIPHRRSPPKPPPFPFHEVRGTTCAECHESPHVARFSDQCEGCHPGPEPLWAAALTTMPRELHALTGFDLADPHTDVDCELCHFPELSFKERYPDPSAPGYLRREDTCQGCHQDAHGGQFTEKYENCLDCHQRHSFTHTKFGQERHASVYPLSGAHKATSCIGCHLVDEASHVRQFIGTSTQCKVCHDNPHGAQFLQELSDGDCDACHNEATDTFSVHPFNHWKQTGYGLVGAHASTDCNSCHVETLRVGGDDTAFVRRYRETPTECASCHKDAHRGQFQEAGRTNCSACHASTSHWEETDFNHNTQARFPLEGAHTRVACSGCHQGVELEDGSQVVQYKPLGRECRDCHEIDAGSPTENVR